MQNNITGFLKKKISPLPRRKLLFREDIFKLLQQGKQLSWETYWKYLWRKQIPELESLLNFVKVLYH